MKTTEITLNNDTTYKDIVATMPAHRIRIRELGLSPVGLIAKLPDDAYTALVNFAAGTIIDRTGNAYHGVLGYPANAIKGSAPASSFVYMKLKASDSSGVKILLEEFEAGELST